MTFVEIVKDVPRASSLVISEGMNQTHRATLILIDKYKKQFDDLGTFSFQMTKTAGRPQRIAWLNEQQTIFLCSLMRNSDHVVEFKKRLAEDFMKMKNALLEIKVRQENPDWQEARKVGKLTRRQETDIIKEFIEYAISQGSKSASRYYGNISDMENKALFILEQKFDNVREVLDGQQLMVIGACDQIVSKALKAGIEEGIFYKEIFQLAKKEVLKFVDLIGKTPVPKMKELN